MQATLKKLSRFFRLSLPEQKVWLTAMLLLPLFWLGLRLFGLSRFQAWLDRFPIARREPLSQTETAALGAVVNSAANQVFAPATCLTRSLFLRWLLRFFGTASDLRIGVRFEGSELAAHAWVEKDGAPVNDCPEAVAGFAAFDQRVSPEMFS